MIYFVPTPIGNLKDITLRSLDVLKESDIILCEDTRTTRKLLEHYDINAKLISYHKFNESQRLGEVIELANEGKIISVVSDAGMPGIADPGNILINELIRTGIKYTVLPGASAFTTALVLSGFDSEEFRFMGFIPSKGSEKNTFINQVKNRKETLVFYETPHRIIDTLEKLSVEIPNRRVCLVREISKIYEDVKIFEAKDFSQVDIVEKGEMVIVIDKDSSVLEITDSMIKDRILELIEEGITKKSAVKEVSKLLNINKNRVYEISLEIEWIK